MGWLLAGVLAMVLVSSSAWALDVDQEIRRQESEAAQILNTLGRDHGTPAGPAVKRDSASEDGVNVRLIPSRRHAKKSS